MNYWKKYDTIWNNFSADIKTDSEHSAIKKYLKTKIKSYGDGL